MATLPNILLLLVALSVGATVIAALIAFRSQREASIAIFPIVREEQASRAQRARISIFVWIAITALFLGGWLATLRLSSPPAPTTERVQLLDQPATNAPQEVAAIQPISTDTRVPEPTPTQVEQPEQPDPQTEVNAVEPEPVPTDTPLPLTNTPTAIPPTPSPTHTNTPSPEPTSTPSPTDTAVPPTDTPVPATETSIPTVEPTVTSTQEPDAPTSTATRANIRPEEAAVVVSSRTPAPDGVRLGPIRFATELTDDMEPVDPGALFPDGTRKIYAVFPYKGMSQGLDFRAIWYKNGTEVAREEGDWVWGSRARSFIFFSSQGEGLYKLELWVNDTVVATKLFEIRKDS